MPLTWLSMDDVLENETIRKMKKFCWVTCSMLRAWWDIHSCFVKGCNETLSTQISTEAFSFYMSKKQPNELLYISYRRMWLFTFECSLKSLSRRKVRWDLSSLLLCLILLETSSHSYLMFLHHARSHHPEFETQLPQVHCPRNWLEPKLWILQVTL